MTPKQFVAMQMSKRFKERKIPDLRHIHHCRRLTCVNLTRGYESTHSSNLFDAEWIYEGYTRFRDRPAAYYPNKVIPWKTLREYM